MRALQYRTVGSPLELVEVDRPDPGPGQVLLEVQAAGMCHSDLFIMGLPADDYVYGLPLTVGHEGVGRVSAGGAGVDESILGQSFAVYGPWGCGRCPACSRGEENYCREAAALGIAPPGLGAPGAMAEYLLVDDVRHLVPIGDMDPVAAVALTDAGLTSYHAVSAVLDRLRPGSTAVIIGVGGLGHAAIQIVRALSSAQIIALDISPERLELAREMGADHALVADEHAVERIRTLTGGAGADVVLDVVGSESTLAVSRESVSVAGAIEIIGIGGGLLPAGFFSTPFGVRVRNPYWGTRSDLAEVVAMAHRGDLVIETEVFTLDQGPEAYGRLAEGTIRGRGVIVP